MGNFRLLILLSILSFTSGCIFGGAGSANSINSTTSDAGADATTADAGDTGGMFDPDSGIGSDGDGDGVDDAVDNCPSISNPSCGTRLRRCPRCDALR